MIRCNLKRYGVSTVVAIAAVLFTTSAAAYTVTVGGRAVLNQGQTTSVSGATVVDFNSDLILPAGYSGGAVVNGLSYANWASPPSDSSNYLTVGSGTDQPSPVTITLGTLNQYFGYYGGSPDLYNSVLLYNGDLLVGEFSGETLASAIPEEQFSHYGDQTKGFYWNIWASNASQYFNVVKLVSTSNAFETDNHAFVSAVPIPAAVWLFLSGMLGLIGFSRQSKAV